MNGRVTADVTAPPVAARRSIVVSFTRDELFTLACDAAVQAANIDTHALKATVTASHAGFFDESVEVRIEFDVPAATPAPLPLTLDFPAPASAPPPAPPTEFLWYEFMIAGVGPFGLRFAWGHGRTKAEAHVDACIRHEGEPGTVATHACRTLIDLPVNVTELYYEFVVGTRPNTFVGKGCTESQGWADVLAKAPAFGWEQHECVGVSRSPIVPTEAPCAI